MDRGEILKILARHGVDSIVVGGTAAVLNGAPVNTFDLDLVYARSAPNVDRLLAALAELDALFRGDPRRIAPDRSHLRTAGRKLLATKYGPLDLWEASRKAPATKTSCPTPFGSKSRVSLCVWFRSSV